MRSSSITAPNLERPYRRVAGEEPLPGYLLLEPLGRGGFGEVWKCEAPGGLHKAIKFVAADAENGDASLQQEFEAFESIKRIRHPFLLTLERVELLTDELIMVMELADEQLQDRFHQYVQKGYTGIPRDELLGYLADAAEMLDHISSKHGLQHLDIKPANLFLVCERVKVGDFGLVRRHELTVSSPGQNRGLTPRYVAPEILHGRVDPRSDQYCLALVYQELLTGKFPYPAKSAQQMMLQHVSAAPDLSPLPFEDRATVARALSKAPTDRFTSCTEFIRTLMLGAAVQETHETWSPNIPERKTSLEIRQSRMTRSHVDYELPASPVDRAGLDPGALTGRMTPPPASVHPQLTTPASRGQLIAPRKPVTPTPPPQPEPVVELVAMTPAVPRGIQLPRIWSVLPVTHLTVAKKSEFIAPDATTLIETLVCNACPDGELPKAVGIPMRQMDGSWTASFPIRILNGVAKLKLELLRENWKAEIHELSPNEFLVRRHNAVGFWDRLSAKRTSGLEVHVKLPNTVVTQVSEAKLTGRIFGMPDNSLIRCAEQLLPEMLDEVHTIFSNTDDRRKSIRVPTNYAIKFYPLTNDGVVGQPFTARARDISLGGLSCQSTHNAETAYVYTVFPEISFASSWAILLRLIRSTKDGSGYSLAGRFRTDL